VGCGKCFSKGKRSEGRARKERTGKKHEPHHAQLDSKDWELIVMKWEGETERNGRSPKAGCVEA